MKRNKFLLLCAASFLAPFTPLKPVVITQQQISDILFKTLEQATQTFKQLGYATKNATISVGRFNASICDVNWKRED